MPTWRTRAAEALERAFSTRQAMADKRDRDRGILRLTVMAEYGCPPLWKGRDGGPVTPESLGLSEALCERVWRWSEAYQSESPDTDWTAWAKEGPEIRCDPGKLGPAARWTTAQTDATAVWAGEPAPSLDRWRPQRAAKDLARSGTDLARHESRSQLRAWPYGL